MSARVVSPVSVGRQDEIAALTALPGRVQDGAPVFAVIGGDAGAGKTRGKARFPAGEPGLSRTAGAA